MTIFNKLVRDRIPDIITASGRTCAVEVLGEEAYQHEMRVKLEEEVQEYLEAENVEDLQMFLRCSLH